MIFNFTAVIILLSFVFFLPSTGSMKSTKDWSTENTSKEESSITKIERIDFDYNNYSTKKEIEPPKIWNLTLDLDANGKKETISIQSYPGFPGDQETKIYIDSNTEPAITEIGYFYAIQTDKIDNSHYILQLQLQTGQSINTLFYTYQKGQLIRVPVSTEKPNSWHGIISRNIPELKDIDNNGVRELLVYYNFLHDPTRKVEVYKFDGGAFIKTQEYEEAISNTNR